MTRRRYAQPEFVGREGELNDALKWADSGRGLFYFVFGPPGVGKSWFLRRFGEKLRDSPHKPYVIEVDVGRLVQNPLQPIGENSIETSEVERWLREFIDEQRAAGINLRLYNPAIQLEQSLINLALDLAAHFGDRPVYLIIDNGDLAQQNAWHDWVERRIIQPFLNIEGAKLRFVAALRDVKQIQFPKHVTERSGECWLTPWLTSETGYAQLQRLLDAQDRLTRDDVTGILPEYDLKHATLTLFLFELALIGESKEIDYDSLVIRGLNALNPLPSDADQQREIIKYVRLIAEEFGDQSWGRGVFADKLGISQNQAAAKDGPIRLLQKQWLLVMGKGGATYQMPGGLSSFVKACDARAKAGVARK